MGLLDDILRSIEEAQRQAEGKGRPQAPARRQIPARPMPEPEHGRMNPEDEDDSDPADEADRVRAHALTVEAVRAQARQAEAIAANEQAAADAQAVQRARLIRSRAAEATAEQAKAKLAAAGTQLHSLLHHRASLRNAIIAHEILGPPPGLRRLRARRRRP